MAVSRVDVELYMLGYIALEETDSGWAWGIDDAGADGDIQYGNVELIEHEDGWRTLRGTVCKTQHEAMEKGLRYIWACRPDIVAIARNDAIAAEKYRAET